MLSGYLLAEKALQWFYSQPTAIQQLETSVMIRELAVAYIRLWEEACGGQ